MCESGAAPKLSCSPHRSRIDGKQLSALPDQRISFLWRTIRVIRTLLGGIDGLDNDEEAGFGTERGQDEK